MVASDRVTYEEVDRHEYECRRHCTNGKEVKGRLEEVEKLFQSCQHVSYSPNFTFGGWFPLTTTASSPTADNNAKLLVRTVGISHPKML
jgi:uncharacterized protein involved in type VI secretion and phage assembly